ncbi:DnaJ domain-containing protein [Microbulbifer sp. SA54]|uniref:J domain-containing protein n=1 Tax=Microbulbifer sp. SA54 TaxID=3401577 RepID=UPI003AAF73DC
MNCWGILEIPEASDRITIKKAYARLIKKFRPDEAPQEFQKINDAYQEALFRLEYPGSTDDQTPHGRSEPLGEDTAKGDAVPEEFLPPGMTAEVFHRINEAIEHFPEDQFELELEDYRITRQDGGFTVECLSALEAQEPAQYLDDPQQQALADALARLDSIFAAPDTANERHWDFLADCRYLLDAEFRYHLTGQILQKIAQYNLSRSGAAQAPVGVGAMERLDQYLNFSQLSNSDFHWISEREWNALRVPRDASSPAGLGVKGGRVERASLIGFYEATDRGIWRELMPLFGGAVMVTGLVLLAIFLYSRGFSQFFSLAIPALLTLFFKCYLSSR